MNDTYTPSVSGERSQRSFFVYYTSFSFYSLLRILRHFRAFLVAASSPPNLRHRNGGPGSFQALRSRLILLYAPPRTGGSSTVPGVTHLSRLHRYNRFRRLTTSVIETAVTCQDLESLIVRFHPSRLESAPKRYVREDSIYFPIVVRCVPTLLLNCFPTTVNILFKFEITDLRIHIPAVVILLLIHSQIDCHTRPL